MKKLAIMLLLLTGCASTPYSIEMVNVRDTLTLQRGEFAGCEMKVANVDTLIINHHGSLSEGELLCGKVECPNPKEYVFDYEKLKCVEFEDARMDRPVHEHNKN